MMVTSMLFEHLSSFAMSLLETCLEHVYLTTRTRQSFLESSLPQHLVPASTPEKIQAVQTRSSSNRRLHPLVLPTLEPLNTTPHEFSTLQKSCPTLRDLHRKAVAGEEETTRGGSTFIYEVSDDLLYRVCRTSNYQDQVEKKILVVPAECRHLVLSLAHKSSLAGHFSHKKTGTKVSS